MNYDIFFPMQLYKNQDCKKYRIEPPSLTLTTPYDYHFDNHFLENVDTPERDKYIKEWKYYRTIWVLNPKYEFFMLPGVIWCFVNQNTDPPFETKTISTQSFNLSANLLSQFIFGSMIMPIPDTVLACFYLDKDEVLIKIVLLDEADDYQDDTTNILPLKRNKDIPFYDLFSNYSHRYLYVYSEKPSFNNWISKNNICIPSEHGSSYFECLQKSVDKMKNRHTYLHDPLIPLTTYFDRMSNKPDKRIISMWILVAIIGLLVLWLIIQSLKSNFL